MLFNYGEPLVSGVEPKLGPQIAAALHAQAQFLEFFSVIMGRQTADKFRMHGLFEADDEFFRISFELSDVDRNLVYDTVLRVASEAMGRFRSQPERHQDSGPDPAEERAGLAKILKVLSPLIDDRRQEAMLAGGKLTERLSEGLLALNAGEITALLKPNVRTAKNVNAHTVAIIKYKFFLMKPLLRQAGFSSAQANSLYEKYAFAVWDSVSRWKRGVNNILSDMIMARVEEEVASYGQNSKNLSLQSAEIIMSDLSISLKKARDTHHY